MNYTFRMDGFAGAFKTLRALRAPGKPIWKKAVRAGAAVVLKAAKAAVPSETKALRKSLAVRIKPRRKDGNIVGIIGPRQKFKAGDRKPSKYAHLVHNGRKGRGAVAGRPYLEDAVRRSRDATVTAMAAKIDAEIAKICSTPS